MNTFAGMMGHLCLSGQFVLRDILFREIHLAASRWMEPRWIFQFVRWEEFLIRLRKSAGLPYPALEMKSVLRRMSSSGGVLQRYKLVEMTNPLILAQNSPSMSVMIRVMIVGGITMQGCAGLIRIDLLSGFLGCLSGPIPGRNKNPKGE
jgi:hypothetical protein